ncbi:hypothetical protein AB0I81_39900 [Nonomuraea sp. NPDC050404]|uniref:hypothetical protein n=1 Tax=Nonomuraea sp. NPDC050404 TaxID=3155783 RepID=UPI0033F23E86
MTIISPQPLTRGEQQAAALAALADLAGIPGLPVPDGYNIVRDWDSDELTAFIQLPGRGLENRDRPRAYVEHLTGARWTVRRYTTSPHGELRVSGQRGTAHVTAWIAVDGHELDDAELLAKALT